jgi:hypothetical protein
MAMLRLEEFEYEGFTVKLQPDLSSHSVTRMVFNDSALIHQDEISFDKSLVANYELMSADEQAKILLAFAGAGIKTWIEDGRFGRSG